MFNLSDATIWILTGIVLIVAEFLVPGVVIVFFGVAAIVVGLLLGCGIALPISAQLIIFGVLGLVLLFALRARFTALFHGASTAEANGVEIFSPGETAEAISAFQDGRGKVLLRGAQWQAELEDAQEAAAGQRLYVVGHRGLILRVCTRAPEQNTAA
ncbi:MAG: NfeD family protein [Rhodocyclaceae bacterium]|nr:NfeD family protein [Rhodocyclaceae bacterium]